MTVAGGLLVGAVAHAADRRAVSGRTFTTKAPAGYSLRTVKGRPGTRSYSMTSRGKASLVAIPPRGAIAVTIYDVPLSVLKLPPTATGKDVLAKSLGTPKGSKNPRHGRVGTTKLDGTTATTLTLTYDYRGRRIVQRDLGVRHGRDTFIIESDADRTNAVRANRAGASVAAAWHWR